MENSLVRSQTGIQRPLITERKDFVGAGSHPSPSCSYASNLPGRVGLNPRIPKQRGMRAYSDKSAKHMLHEIIEDASQDTWVPNKFDKCTDYLPHIHSSSRLLLHPASSGLEKASDDGFTQWNMIVEIVSFVNEELKCPVCLCSPMVPRMTKCGHIYCWPCIIKYINFENETSSKKCPVCTVNIDLMDLKRVTIIRKDHFQVGSVIEIVLVKRRQDCCSIKCSRPESSCDKMDYSFTKRLTWDAMRTMIQEDFDALFAYKVVCDGDLDGESVVGIEAALDYLSEELRLFDQQKARVSLNQPKIDASDEECDPTSEVNFYQAYDGQPIFLDGLMWKCMLTEYGTVDLLPSPIMVTVSSIKQYKMTVANRRRWRFLSHLPLGYSFQLIEVDLYPSLISESTVNQYAASLRNRSIKQEYRRQEDIRLTKLKEAAENHISNIPQGFILSGHASLTEQQKLPMDSDFVPLCPTSQVAIKATCSSGSFAEVTKSGALSVVDQNRVANFRRGPPPTRSRPTFDPKRELWPTLGSATKCNLPQANIEEGSYETNTNFLDSGDHLRSFDTAEQNVKKNRRRRRRKHTKDTTSDSSSLFDVPS